MDARFSALNDWLVNTLDYQEYDIAPASADASFRRYFRVEDDRGSRIVMDAPPDKEDCGPFIKVSALMSQLGLNVPVVLEKDLQQGFLLLSDLGNQVYLDHLNPQTVEQLYGDAMQALLKMQQAQQPDVPDYDRELLLTEMGLFRDWYLQRHLEHQLTEQQQQMLDDVFELLASEALSQPKVLVHRDYHSRNLMLCDTSRQGANPGILDFQDAVFGPVTYDLVSLLRDCYIDWPLEQVHSWVSDYHQMASRAGILDDVSEQAFLRWFDLMGIQRHLKASGIFARLNHRDNKPGYLGDIPRTLGYVVSVSRTYPELQAFAEFIREVSPDVRQVVSS